MVVPSKHTHDDRRLVGIALAPVYREPIREGTVHIGRLCDTLSTIRNDKPTLGNIDCINLALQIIAFSPSEISRILVRLALLWGDSNLWSCTADALRSAGQGISILSEGEVFDAVLRFGFVIEQSFIDLLQNERGNTTRIKFLDRLESWLLTQQTSTSISDAWMLFRSARQSIVCSLRNPEFDDLPIFMNLALRNGTILYFENFIMPQMKKLGPVVSSGFLRELACVAFDEPRFPDPQKDKDRVCSGIMRLALSLDPLSHHPEMGDPSYKITEGFFRARQADTPLSEAKARVMKTLLPLLELFAAHLRKNPDRVVPRAPLRDLLQEVNLIFPDLIMDPATTKDNISRLIGVMHLPYGLVLFETLVVPFVHKMRIPLHSLRYIIEALRQLSHDVASQGNTLMFGDPPTATPAEIEAHTLCRMDELIEPFARKLASEAPLNTITSAFASRACAWKWFETPGQYPVVQVIKSTGLITDIRFKEVRRTEGIILLNRLAQDDEEKRKLLGPHYTTVMKVLG
ncbi:hypothetical protein EIP91_000334 [Steccherinum ochraceum]|uniref:Uncharacterized protein n=1 Tax=Steccherinum ochraceum TaxID=92696 RepID=A0A4V2MWR8_9APHY|nr:hypothetical protein EIP91_000334 [Steccherinum ochraceum]